MFKYFLAFCVTFSTSCFAQEETAMQKSLQKELYEIYVNDANEMTEKYLEDGTFYTNSHLQRYQSIFSHICKDYNVDKCPVIYFTKTDIAGAAMYPNGTLAIEENSAQQMNDEEITFILAHEFSHFQDQDTYAKSKAMAKSVVENAVPILEPEQVIPISTMLPGVKEFHYKTEDKADMFAWHYLQKNNMNIDCLSMFKKVMHGETPSTDEHDTVQNRCAKLH